MTDTRQTKIATVENTAVDEQSANGIVVNGHRPQVRHRVPGTVTRPTERSKRMITQEMAHRGFGELEDLLAGLVDGGRESSLLLATRDARAALAHMQEDAAIEAEDGLSQADEALVLG